MRLRHVDSLRAVAATLVVWMHYAHSLAPLSKTVFGPLALVCTVPQKVDAGRIGVMIFFAISGFVMCRSFGGPPDGAQRRFIIRRLCRLYPAFWASMLPGALVWWSQGRWVTGSLLAANATMLPSFFGQPDLVGVYWTLEIELVFYALCLALFSVGWLRRPALVAAASLTLAALPRTLHLLGRASGTALRLPGDGDTWTISLAVMCWGAVFRLLYDRTGGFRRDLSAGRPILWLTLLTLAVVDLHNPHLKEAAWRTGVGLPSFAIPIAMLIFTLWVAVGRIESRWLTALGVISYSVYLFHPEVLYGLERLLAASHARGWAPLPLLLNGGIGFAVTIALSVVVHRWVERPGIALGKRHTAVLR